MTTSIDLRETKCVYINLDSATRNKEEMENQLNDAGFKDFERLSARVVPPPTPEPPDNIPGCETWWNIFRGVAQSHIDILENNDAPVLVLEDDATIDLDHFKPVLDYIPDDTDGIYLGISQSDGRYKALDIGQDWLWMRGIFSTHAILYLSERYKKAVIDVAKDFAYNKNIATDLGWCSLQDHFNIITPHKPYFYQGDARESLNKWENLTRTPLRITEELPPPSNPIMQVPDGPQGTMQL